jgi:hypothetical protein
VGGAALVSVALLGVSPTTLRETLRYWRHRTTPSPRHVPSLESGAEAARLGWSPWSPWGPSLATLQPLGDSLLLILTPAGESGPQLFDGRNWRTIAVPGWNVPKAIVGRDTVWFYSSVRSHQLPTVVYALTRTGLALVDSIPNDIYAVWGDGTQALLATADGGMLRGRPGDWHREPTGTRVLLTRIFGDVHRQVALGNFGNVGARIPDSLLVFNGLNWRTVDPRPDTTRSWVYNDGDALPDGTLLVAGWDCSTRDQQRCRGLVAQLAPGSDRWQLVASMPENVQFRQVVAGRSGEAWLLGQGRGCGADACLFRLTSRGLEKIPPPPSQSAVTNVSFLHGEPVVVDARGVLWIRPGSWGVLGGAAGEVPGWILRGIDPVTAEPWSDGTIASQGVSGVQSVVSAPGKERGHRWILAGGRIFEDALDTARYTLPASELQELPPPGGAVSAIAVLGSQLIAAPPRGGVVQWEGRWQAMRGGISDSIVAFASGEGRAVAALGRTALWRWDTTGHSWSKWQILPDWLGRPLRFAVDPQVSSAFVVGDAENAVLRPPGVLERAPLVGGTPASVTVLDDGRAVLAFPAVDPLLSGRLVITSPLARGDLHFSTLQPPTGANFYSVWREPCRLYGAGSGRMVDWVDQSRLPLADTASGTLELPAELPKGDTLAVEGAKQPGTGRRPQVPPGMHQVILKARGYTSLLGSWCVMSRRITKSKAEAALAAALVLAARAQQIPIDTSVTGQLTMSDPVMPDQTYYRLFTFRGTAGQTVQIDLKSADFDAYLYLKDQNGQAIAQNDDSGGGTNARIIQSLPYTGMYQIYANTLMRGHAGAFTLRLQSVRP